MQDQPRGKEMRNTILMLNLAVAQISLSMNDGDESVNTLGKAFSLIMTTMQKIQMLVSEIADTEPKKALIEYECAGGSQKVGEIVVAFQFYDKLSQRLSHVSNSLGSLAEIIGDEKRLYHPDTWLALQSYIRSKYTMREEVEMFDAIIQGYTVEEALKKVAEQESVADDEIELF